MELKKVLEFFSRGICDQREIAAELKIQVSDVKNAIALLEKKGLIKSEGCDSSAPKCMGCPMAQMAAEMGGYYMLTKEGWEYLKK